MGRKLKMADARASRKSKTALNITGIKITISQDRKEILMLVLPLMKCNVLSLSISQGHPCVGGYSKLKITDVLWIQLIFSPWFLIQYIMWYIRWIWKFGINREEYGEEEKHYLIQRNLGVSKSQYDSIEDNEKDEMFRKQLWEKDKYMEYKRQKDEEMKAKLAESSKYRSYRRYMKNRGPGRMTFED